jgi:hypothetical protein
MLLSPLQMTDATSWKGLTTENHLGAIWQSSPQKASDLITMIQQKYFGDDLEGFLNKFPVKYFENDTDYTWELMSQGIDNIALIEARIDGTAVTAASKAGEGFSTFELVFDKDWFSHMERIVGELNEKYPIRITAEPTLDGSYFVYQCELITGDPNDFIPFEEISGGQLFSREYAPVSRTMSQKGRQIKFKSHITMRNAFSQIRIEKKTPGNLTNRKMGTYIKDDHGSVHKMWQAYESFMFDHEFRMDINRVCMFGTANRTVDGNYMQKDPSGYSIVEGSGLREQSEASNTSFYNTFSIEDLSARLLDISEGKLSYDEREFMMRCGERGAYQFHKALEDFSQLYVPSRESSRIGSASANYARQGMSYGGQFVEYRGPNNILVQLAVDSAYDNRNRNKKNHADGGVTESYRYDIYDIGTTDGEANIQKVGQKDHPFVIHKYIPGLRNPFSPDGAVSAVGTAEDAWEEHKMWIGGVMLKDPSKTASFIYNTLA